MAEPVVENATVKKVGELIVAGIIIAGVVKTVMTHKEDLKKAFTGFSGMKLSDINLKSAGLIVDKVTDAVKEAFGEDLKLLAGKVASHESHAEEKEQFQFDERATASV